MTTPFYGAADAELFAVGRADAHQPGRVIAELDQRLPDGLILDVSAGDGFLAQALTNRRRTVVPVERPAVDRRRGGLPSVGARPHQLPFWDGTLTGAYATQASPDDGVFDPELLLAELHRTVRRGGPLVVIATLGPEGTRAAIEGWTAHGFECEVVDTAFSADRPYRFGVFTAPSRGIAHGSGNSAVTPR